MAVIRRRVYDTLLDPLGQPLAGVTVEAKLVDAAFYRPDPSLSIMPVTVSTTTNDAGFWALDLIPNALLAPRGNYYIVRILNKFFYVWIPADSTDPVRLTEVVVGEHDICQTDLPGLSGIRVENQPPLRGLVTLKEGTEISLEQDYDNRTITIHGRKYLPGTEIDIVQTDPVSYTIHGRRIIGEHGIVVTPTSAYERTITPVYGTQVPPVAAQSSPGILDEIARVDHTHEGVHSINNLVGDINLVADVGINILTNSQNNQFLIANDPHQVVFGREFEVIRVTGGSNTQTGVDWFNADLGNVSGWVARRTDTNEDVTNILTDNNQSTGVTINQNTSILITLPNRMVISQLWINASNSSFQVLTVLTDGSGNQYTTAYGYVSSVSGNLYQVTFFKAPAIADVIIINALPYDYHDYLSYGGEVFISEVRVNRGMLFKAPYLASPGSSAIAVFTGNVFLRSGFTYKLCTYWGMGDYLGDGTFSPPQPEITGRGMIICPNGIEIDLGSFGWKGALAPPYHNAIYCHETIITPPSTGFATVSFILTTSPYTPDYEHAYLLGLILRPQW